MSEAARNALALLRREFGSSLQADIALSRLETLVEPQGEQERTSKRRKGGWTYKLQSLLECLLLARLLRHAAVWLNLAAAAAAADD